MSGNNKRENFLDQYLVLDNHGAHLAECESVQIGQKRYRFKINGVVTVSPEMLKGEIGKRAREMKKDEKHQPTKINVKSRKRRMSDDQTLTTLKRWLPQHWTPFIKKDKFGIPRIYDNWHIWYGGYYVDPFVASALAVWTVEEYERRVKNAFGMPQGPRIVALQDGVQGGATIVLDNKEAAQRHFQLGALSEVTKLMRKESLIEDPSTRKQYLLQFELFDKSASKAESLAAVTKALNDIFANDVPCGRNDGADDGAVSFNCVRNISDTTF